MTGAEFEYYVGQVLHENGHHAAVTRASGDYGVDLVLNGEIAVQVKFLFGSCWSRRGSRSCRRQIYVRLF